MKKKLYIALSAVAVLAVVIVAVATQGNYFKGSFSPLSAPLSTTCVSKPLSVGGTGLPCTTKPLSVPVSGTVTYMTRANVARQVSAYLLTANAGTLSDPAVVACAAGNDTWYISYVCHLSTRNTFPYNASMVSAAFKLTPKSPESEWMKPALRKEVVTLFKLAFGTKMAYPVEKSKFYSDTPIGMPPYAAMNWFVNAKITNLAPFTNLSFNPNNKISEADFWSWINKVAANVPSSKWTK